MTRSTLAVALALALVPSALSAADVVIEPREIVEMKAVFGRVERREVLPARARLGGTLVELKVREGDRVRAGDVLGRVQDDKLTLQLRAAEARARALSAELANTETELVRARTLVERGAGTVQRVDQLRTQADVLRNQLAAAEAERAVILQQASEGDVLAPADGRVLRAPLTRGAVVMPGEPVAQIGVGGAFLRLALPERHAEGMREGETVAIEGRPAGRIARVLPQIEGGRVFIDVDMPGEDPFFVGGRVLVHVPIGRRSALVVPAAAIERRAGLDIVRVRDGDRLRDVAVVPGPRHADGTVEILSGLRAGDRVVVP